MAGGPEDHFTDSRELYVLVEGDEWLLATRLARVVRPSRYALSSAR